MDEIIPTPYEFLEIRIAALEMLTRALIVQLCAGEPDELAILGGAAVAGTPIVPARLERSVAAHLRAHVDWARVFVELPPLLKNQLIGFLAQHRRDTPPELRQALLSFQAMQTPEERIEDIEAFVMSLRQSR